MAIEFIELSSDQVFSSVNQPFHVTSGPAMAIAILVVPIFDTLRVFTLRLLNKKSPFSPDRPYSNYFFCSYSYLLFVIQLELF